ncbi:hypothetical protein AUK41_01560 [Candidatus Berkelbacteria bacterium CG2_30_43_20]|nr:MAG: hypothetical protein AUK41_01560 [Candidatus Berkelbacteria bacterium CG2_30_43_20]
MKKLYIFGIIVASLTVLYLPFVAHAQIGAQYPNGFNRVQGKGDFDKYSYDYSVWCNVASDVGGILSIDRSSASTDTYTCAPASASTYYSAKQFPSSYFAQKENSSRILCNYENGGTGGVYSTKRDQYIDHYYCKKSGSSSSGGTGSGGTTSSGGSTGTGTSPSTGSGSSSGTGGLGNESLAEMTVTVPSLGVFSDIGTYLSTLITRYGIPFAVMAALILIMYAGWHYIHSGGSPEGQKLAKELIVGALLGLLVLFMIGYALTVIIPQEELNSSGTTGQANGATITVKLPAQIKSLKGKLSGN